MARLTITLSDARLLALEKAAAKRGTTVTALIEDSLDKSGIRSSPSADELVARARAWAGLDEEETLRLAVEETRAARKA